MRNLLVALTIGCAAFIPASTLHAAPRSKDPVNFATKSFGGFEVGKTFTFKVRLIESSKAVGGNFNPKVPIPPSLPKFRNKQKIRFTIGDKGQLVGPGFSIPIYGDSDTLNTYSAFATPAKPKPPVANVSKEGGEPTSVDLYFYKQKTEGDVTSVNTVHYQLF